MFLCVAFFCVENVVLTVTIEIFIVNIDALAFTASLQSFLEGGERNAYQTYTYSYKIVTKGNEKQYISTFNVKKLCEILCESALKYYDNYSQKEDFDRFTINIEEEIKMGFRYRKSINLGGGFRINLSKSGIGYSWGTKGHRVTKTAKGTTRTTASIPGTGLSYVSETKNQRKQSSQSNPNPAQQPNSTIDNCYDTKEITNNVATQLVSEGLEKILASANTALLLTKISKVGFIIFLIIGFYNFFFEILSVIFALMYILVRIFGVVNLDYEIDEDKKAEVDSLLNPMIQIMKCQKVWRITQKSKVIDKKYTAGASVLSNRTVCQTSQKPPFPFKANVSAATFKAGNETLIFLPDKLFIIQGNKIGALNYDDISFNYRITRYIEEESVPSDALIVDKTWKYVNKSGGQDMRFKDNKMIPVCLYGKLEFKSKSGLNTIIMFSNVNIAKQL